MKLGSIGIFNLIPMDSKVHRIGKSSLKGMGNCMLVNSGASIAFLEDQGSLGL
jgi:hypothetical protein